MKRTNEWKKPENEKRQVLFCLVCLHLSLPISFLFLSLSLCTFCLNEWMYSHICIYVASKCRCVPNETKSHLFNQCVLCCCSSFISLNLLFHIFFRKFNSSFHSQISLLLYHYAHFETGVQFFPPSFAHYLFVVIL